MLLDLLNHETALGVERSESLPEADHVLHPALRFGWLWRSDRGRVSWQFTATVARRSYPPDAEFLQVYVPVVLE